MERGTWNIVPFTLIVPYYYPHFNSAFVKHTVLIQISAHVFLFFISHTCRDCSNSEESGEHILSLGKHSINTSGV